MNRQSLIVIIIGAIASLSGFWTFDFFRARRCAELGGTWAAAARQCRLPTGEVPGTASIMAVLAGALVAAMLGITLYRAYIFATGRARRANPT